MKKTSPLFMLSALLAASLLAQAESPATSPAAAPATQPGKELSVEINEKLTLKFALVPPGKFTMGVDQPDPELEEQHAHEVTISRPFYMATTPVTVDQFAAFVKDTKYKTEVEIDHEAVLISIGNGGVRYYNSRHLSWKVPGYTQKGDHPVVMVSWNDAQAFCQWLSKKSGKTVKLPTEAQWEYACRAGSQTIYPWGDKPEDGKGHANCADQSLQKLLTKHFWTGYFPWDDGFVYTSPVATFKPNAFGLYDMIGNVWQWCEDRADENAEEAEDAAKPATDPTGAKEGEQRVYRGGSWFNRIGFCRTTARGSFKPACRTATNGFRVMIPADTPTTHPAISP